MEPKAWSVCSQDSTTSPCAELCEPILHPPIVFVYKPKILRWPFSFRFSCQKAVWISLLVPVCFTCPFCLNILDLIILIIFSKDEKAWSSSLCSLSCLLLLPTFWAQIPSSAPYLCTPTVSALPLIWEIKFVCTVKCRFYFFCGEHIKMV